jgi:hypothetical protein
MFYVWHKVSWGSTEANEGKTDEGSQRLERSPQPKEGEADELALLL